MEPIKKVLVNVPQSFTEIEKAQGRANLGCAAASDIPSSNVLYTPQTLTLSEQMQARDNIAAASTAVATQSANGLMSITDKIKLDGIAAGAEVNVQADWNQTNTSADDYIKNKPSIPSVIVTDVTVDGTSVVSNGTAAITMPTALVPPVTSNDDSKVLTASYNGGVGSYSWVTSAAGGAEVVWLTYNSTMTPQDVVDIYNNIINKSKIYMILYNNRIYTATGVYSDGINRYDILFTNISNNQVEYPWNSLARSFVSFIRLISQSTIGWYISDRKFELVPTPASTDNNKVLTAHGDGTYYDLTWETPSSGTVSDVTVNGTSVVNAQGTAVVTVPTNTSDLNNDSGFITSSQVPAQVNSDWNSSSGVSEILNKPSLATVAISGSYTDLINTPTIPAAQVNSDWNAVSGVAEILNKPTINSLVAGSNITITESGNATTISATQSNSDWNASSGVTQILNKPESKYFLWDTSSANGFDIWANIYDASDHYSAYLPICLLEDDPSNPSYNHAILHTNFSSTQQSGITVYNDAMITSYLTRDTSTHLALSKGLWYYEFAIELVPTQLVSGIADMTINIYSQVYDTPSSIPSYYMVKNINVPVNCNVQSTYTRMISGVIYSIRDFTFDSQGLLSSGQTLSVMFDINSSTVPSGAAFKFRQTGLHLVKLGV